MSRQEPIIRSVRSRFTAAISLILVICLGFSLSAAIFETTVRLFVPVSDFFWQWDPVVGLKLIPNKTGRSVKRGVFDVDVRINSHGFRDREHTPVKPPGVRRIVLLGDSFIEALQVPFENSLAPLLEHRLQAAGINAETVSLGISGFGTAREYLLLREYGLKYKPDLVLHFFVGNDVSDNSRRLQGLPYLPYPMLNDEGSLARDEKGRPRFTAFADQSSSLAFVTTYLKNISNGFRLVREAVDRSPQLHGLLYRFGLMSTPPEPVNRPEAANFGYHELYRSEYTKAWAEAWALTENLLLATRDLAEFSGARFAVVLVPAAWEVYPHLWQAVLSGVPAMKNVPLDLEKPSRTLSSFLVRNQIPVISMLADFRKRSTELPLLYVPSDAHWTAHGHRLASELLADRVTALLQEPVPESAQPGQPKNE